MSLDPDTTRRIAERAKEIAAAMPPMTDEECAAVARILDECRVAAAKEAIRKKREGP